MNEKARVHRGAQEINSAFANVIQLGAGGIVIGNDPFFNTRSDQFGALTVRYAMPTISQFRQFAAAGGLMSYGGRIADSYVIAGSYAGRILKGEKAGDLPVQGSTQVELIINMKAAKALGLTIPITLLGRADEVIE